MPGSARQNAETNFAPENGAKFVSLNPHHPTGTRGQTMGKLRPRPASRPSGLPKPATAERIAIARAELAKHAPPIDFTAAFDSLEVLEKIVRHFYLRGLIEQSAGVETDWKAADAALVQAASIAKDVVKYRHAALSAVRLAGDINATGVPDNATLDELIVKIKEELRKLGPLIDLEAIREPQGVENRLPVTVTTEGSEGE
jgi:hypothetical protein